MMEAGVPGYELSIWFGGVVPAGTPPSIIEKLSREIVRILSVKDIRESLLSQGFDPEASTPDEFSKYLKSEIERYTRIVKAAGIPTE